MLIANKFPLPDTTGIQQSLSRQQQSDSLIAVCLLQLYRKDTFISGSRCRRRRLWLAAVERRGGYDECRTSQERRPGPQVAQDQPGHAARHKDGDGRRETLLRRWGWVSGIAISGSGIRMRIRIPTS